MDRIKWQAYEYDHRDRPRDWYWSLGILALACAITSLILGNTLFAVFILIAAFSAAIHSHKPPDIFEFELNQKGLRIGNKMYPYSTLEAFWIEDEIYDRDIIIKSQKAFMPYIVVPLGDQNPATIRDYLLNYLEETEMTEPLAHKLMEYLGF